MVEEKARMKANNKILKELDAIYEDHKKKHGNRVMSDKELKRLLGL